MSERARRGGLVGPLLLIGLGVIFLLNNLGVLAVNIWDVIFRLWPVILIAIGLDLLIGRRSVGGSLLVLVLILVVFIGGVWLIGVEVRTTGPSSEIFQPLESMTKAEVSISPSIGLLHVESLDPGSRYLAQGKIRLMSGEDLRQDFNPDRDPASFALRSSGQTWFPAIGGWGEDATWDLGLNPDVALILDLSLGVGKIEVDLTGLDVTAFEVSLGLGKTIITLPEEGRFTAKISGAIGETYVIVPSDMAVRSHVSTGIGTSSLPPGYTRQGDTYVSPGYESAENRVDLDISQAIGMISVVSLGR
ncbi:MAG TPA: cell wall-active antibiotics response protein [Anaerolineae bacterium]|nr:cell wall-active antibiotics response protein [Anaerolineae bacterium]